MRAAVCVLLLAAAGATPAGALGSDQVPGATPATVPGVVAEVRIHGNYRTPDDEVVRLSGLTIGQPWPAGGAEEIAARLRRSGLFVDVDVRKRYRSLDETGEVAVLIVVQEHPGSVIDVPTGPPNPVGRFLGSTMFAPVLDYTDGYGFTYGARASFVHVLGREGRLSVPFTWGARKQAAVEADKTFFRGPIGRLAAAASISSRENPAFRLDDERREVSGEAWAPLGSRAVSLGLAGGVARVDFGGVRDRFATYGARLVLDTRDNPAFPRNAVHVSAGWRVFDPDAGRRANRYAVDARGFVGLFGSPVLAVRAALDRSDGPLPAYEKALAGGTQTLRGFRAGSFVGDNLAAASIELRLPTHSPMRLGQSGFTVFADGAAVYDHGTRLGDAVWHYGFGAGWYVRAPLISFGIDVAHGRDRGTRAHVTAGLRF